MARAGRAATEADGPTAEETGDAEENRASSDAGKTGETGNAGAHEDRARPRAQDGVRLVSTKEVDELLGGDLPSHPLDPTPLIQSAARTTGAGLELGLLAIRKRARELVVGDVSCSAPEIVCRRMHG